MTLDDPQLQARDFFEPVEHPLVGEQEYPGWPMRFSGGPVGTGTVRRPPGAAHRSGAGRGARPQRRRARVAARRHVIGDAPFERWYGGQPVATSASSATNGSGSAHGRRPAVGRSPSGRSSPRTRNRVSVEARRSIGSPHRAQRVHAWYRSIRQCHERPWRKLMTPASRLGRQVKPWHVFFLL